MQLVVITRGVFFDGESEVLNSLFEAGLEGLHLRKPEASDEEMRGLLKNIHPEFRRRIIIHGHIELYAEFGLLGVHFPLEVLFERGRIQHLGKISCSAHTHAEVTACSEIATRVFISPVYDSISKKGYVGNEKLLSVPKINGKAVLVALGGITPERLPIVHQHGFKAAALMGYIWESRQPQQRFEACQTAVAEIKTKADDR